MKQKERLDVLLVQKGLVETREKAKKIIMAGLVTVNQEIVDKSGIKIDLNSDIKIKGLLHPYVSRGGLKLERAINFFNLDLTDKIVIDIGASTGGFTDCALQFGAKKVYAIDVGYGQLAWKLRQDQRVIVWERTNFRYIDKNRFADKGYPNFATIDVSFISLRIILPVLYDILTDQGEIVALVKPQFEAGKENVGKNGIVKDRTVHLKVLKDIITFATNERYFYNGLTYSPITGSEGNIEFLLYLTKKEVKNIEWQNEIIQVIEEAHINFH